MIHTTADFEFKEIVRFHPRGISAGIEAICKGKMIITDTNMARVGIRAKDLTSFGGSVKCYMNDPLIHEKAKSNGTTRAKVAVSECSDGIPDHGNFAAIMQKGDSAQDILDYVFALEEPVLDQWQAQVLCDILTRCEVKVYSGMERASIEMCKLGYIDNLQKTVEEHISSLGPNPRAAVLPDGPLTIPFIKKQ